MNPESDSHEHVLWSLYHYLFAAEQVASLQGLEAEIVEIIITIVDNGGI